MGYPDIDLARTRHSALRRVVAEHSGGVDPRGLRLVLALCRQLREAIDDDYCRRKVLVVEECAAELLCASEPRARGSLSGADFLRREIRDALELVQSRLYSLERARRQAQPSAISGSRNPVHI